MSQFHWGKVIDKFEYDFDGKPMTVTKYNIWQQTSDGVVIKKPSDEIMYHCQEINESADSLEYLLIAWIARKNLGQNQYALVKGVALALGVDKFH